MRQTAQQPGSPDDRRLLPHRRGQRSHHYSFDTLGGLTRRMELFDHPDPRLTRWVIENGYLETPFVVVDVGCQGGEHVRWRWLGEHLEVHGFDPLAEAIDALDSANHLPGKRRFYNMALGNEEGERELFVTGQQLRKFALPTGRTTTVGR